MSKLQEFLAGDRPDDIALYLSESFLDADSRLRNVGPETGNGVVVVVDGETGRRAFAAGTDMEAMEFAQSATQTEGDIDGNLNGGNCPEADEGDASEHQTEFVFAFAEEQKEDVGGLYAEGAVVHAYAQCECGVSYSDKWVVEE
jgi:hypothetical protein